MEFLLVCFCVCLVTEQEPQPAEMTEHQAPADQTTLVPNEEEAFALEPIDITGKSCC